MLYWNVFSCNYAGSVSNKQTNKHHPSMISATKTTFRHYNLKIFRHKAMKNIKKFQKNFCELPLKDLITRSLDTLVGPFLLLAIIQPIDRCDSWTNIWHFILLWTCFHFYNAMLLFIISLFSNIFAIFHSLIILVQHS